MRVLKKPARVELVIQRSRFLGILEQVESPETARSLLKEAKARYSDASHVVHAFRTGMEGSETLGCSDDGEPSGTAGRPVLEVLNGAGGGQALLLVVRWFGGTKLGTGGLVRAYGDTAKAVIEQAGWEEAGVWVLASITIPWAEHRSLRSELAQLGAIVDQERFDSDVFMVARIPVNGFDALQTKTRDLSRGRVQWVRCEADRPL